MFKRTCRTRMFLIKPLLFALILCSCKPGTRNTGDAIVTRLPLPFTEVRGRGQVISSELFSGKSIVNPDGYAWSNPEEFTAEQIAHARNCFLKYDFWGLDEQSLIRILGHPQATPLDQEMKTEIFGSSQVRYWSFDNGKEGFGVYFILTDKQVSQLFIEDGQM